MSERLTRWEGQDPDGTPRAVLTNRDGNWNDNIQAALRKLAQFEDAEEEVHQYYDSIFIDCSPGTGREHIDISKMVREMSQQIPEHSPRHLTSRFQIPEYISKKRVSAFQEKLKELGAMPSRHPSDAFAMLPYTMKFTEMMGDDK